jgi:hypothetical protein
MEDLAQGCSFNNQVPPNLAAESIHGGSHSLQVTKAFLARVSHEPKIRVKDRAASAKHPHKTHESGHSQRIVADTGPRDAVVTPLEPRGSLREDRVQVRCYDERIGICAARQTPIYILVRVQGHIQQGLCREKVAHEHGALVLLKGGSRHLLYPYGEVKESIDGCQHEASRWALAPD